MYLPSFIFQLFVQAFLAALIAWSLEVAMEGLGLSEIGHSHELAMVIQVIKPIVISVAGLLLGATAFTWWKSIRASALWVWVGPVGVLTLALGWDMSLFGWRRSIPEFFVWMRPGLDEPPLTLYLLVYPAISALSYSLGGYISKRRVSPRSIDANSTSTSDVPGCD